MATMVEAAYRDTGCEVSASCLNCPLPQCKHDLEPETAANGNNPNVPVQRYPHGLLLYVNPPPGRSALKRGGTRCWCGAEKDRRSKNCKEHRARPAGRPAYDPMIAERNRDILQMRANGWTLARIGK